MARWLMLLGALLLMTGILLQFAPWTLNWFGKLPGDIRVQSERGTIFIPVTSMIIVSIVLTILLHLFKR